MKWIWLGLGFLLGACGSVGASSSGVSLNADLSEKRDYCAEMKRLAISDQEALLDLGLSEQALSAIESFKAGDDGVLNTLDDRYFSRREDFLGLHLNAEDVARLGGEQCVTEELQLLAFNDLHGALDPPTVREELGDGEASAVLGGGILQLAGTLASLREGETRSLTVSAGDNIGASPFVSALFWDEPTILGLNLLGLDMSSVGNHEFDRGYKELLRKQNGACHEEEGCFLGKPFEGASFSYLGANVYHENTGEVAFPPYEVRLVGKVPVAFIGLTLEKTADIVTPSGTEGLRFGKEVEAVLEIRKRLKKQGVSRIVLLLHQGVRVDGGPNDCEDPKGELLEIMEALSGQVDLVISGHTHQAYLCEFGGLWASSAGHSGQYVTEWRLSVDEKSHALLSLEFQNHPVTSDEGMTPPALTELVAFYKEGARAKAEEVLTHIDEDFLTKPMPSGEMPLGLVIADAQLWMQSQSDPHGPIDFALMNPGGVRADILVDPPRQDDASGQEKGAVRYSDVFSVQPFGNTLVSLTLSGEELMEVLEMQFGFPHAKRSRPRILQVSKGLSFAYDRKAPLGSRISKVKVHGKPLDLKKDYRLVANRYLADGGDRFEVLKKGRERHEGRLDVEALADYLKAHPKLKPPKKGRIEGVF